MDIKLKSNRVTRDVPDLSDYTKISIPWDSSGNDKLYVYMKPDEHSQKVYIGSDENKKGKERRKSLTFSTIKSGVNTGTQSKATLNVIQEKAVRTYRLIISVQGGASNIIPPSGGSIQLQTILETYIGDRLENSALVNSTYVNTSSGEGSYFTVSSKGLVTGVNRGTTVGNKRRIIVKATYISGLINVTDSLVIYLEANSASYGNVSLTVTSPVNLDATGGTYTINPTASQTVSYTSGSTKNNTAANGGISLSYTQVSSSSGFSLSGNKVTYTNNNNTTSSRSYQVNVIATGEGSKTNTKTITFTQSADSIISTTYSNDIVGFGGDGRFSGVSVALYNNQQINSQYVLPASAVTTSNPIKIMADNPAVVRKTVTYSSGYKEESLVPASEAYPGKIVYIKIGLVESSNDRVSRTEIVTNSHTTNLFNDGINITYNSYGTININQYKANVILGVSIVSATEAANRYNTNKTNFVNFNKYTLLLSGNKVESYDLSTKTVSYVGYKKTSSGSIFTDKTNYPDGLDYGGYFIYDVTVKGSEVYTSGSTVVKGKAVIPTLSSKLPSDNVASIQYPMDALENPEILSQQGDVSNGNSVTRISIHVVRLNDKTSSEQVYLQFGVGGEYGSNNALAEFRVIRSRKAIVVGSIGGTEGSINLLTPNGITSTSRGFTFTITDSSGQVDGTTLTGNTTWPSVQQMGLVFLLKDSNHKSNLINLLKDVLRSYGNYAVIRSSSSSLPQFNGTKWTLTQDEKSELWRILLVRSSALASLYAIDYDR